MADQEKRIIFRTSAPITYQLPGKDIYESIRTTGLGDQFPHINTGHVQDITSTIDSLGISPEETVIFTATTEQALDTTNVITQHLGIPAIEDPALNPPRFDLADFMSPEDFRIFGDDKYNVLRNRYLRAFYENRFLETKEDLYLRFNELIERYSQEEARTVLAVSHAFLMRFYEVFHTQGDIALTDYTVLSKTWNPDQNPYGRLGGFEINITNIPLGNK